MADRPLRWRRISKSYSGYDHLDQTASIPDQVGGHRESANVNSGFAGIRGQLWGETSFQAECASRSVFGDFGRRQLVITSANGYHFRRALEKGHAQLFRCIPRGRPCERNLYYPFSGPNTSRQNPSAAIARTAAICIDFGGLGDSCG